MTDKAIETTAIVGVLFLTAWLVMLSAPLVAGAYLGFWQCLVGLWVGRAVFGVLSYRSGTYTRDAD